VKRAEARAPYGGSSLCAAPYQPEEQRHPGHTPPTGFDALRTIAVSRIYSTLRSHHRLLVGMGMKLAQVALSTAAGRSAGTINRGTHLPCRATSPQLQTEAEMVKSSAQPAQRRVQRHTFTEPIKFLVTAQTANESEPPSGKSRCWR